MLLGKSKEPYLLMAEGGDVMSGSILTSGMQCVFCNHTYFLLSAWCIVLFSTLITCRLIKCPPLPTAQECM